MMRYMIYFVCDCGSRSLLISTKKVQYGGRVIKDNQTGRSIDKRTILNPEEIAGTHEMGEAWSKGGDKIGLGDAKLNKRLGAS